MIINISQDATGKQTITDGDGKPLEFDTFDIQRMDDGRLLLQLGTYTFSVNAKLGADAATPSQTP